MLNVVIAEPIPSLNKGEAAILRGIQESLNIYGDVNLTVYSPPCWINDDRKRYGDEIKIVDGLDLWDVENLSLERSKRRSRIYSLQIKGKLLGFSLIVRLSKRLANYLVKDNFLKSLANADLIMAGHNGGLGYHLFWIVLAAKIMNKPIALFGGGNDLKGRHKKVRVRKMLQFAVHNSIICTVRDENSKNYLIANGVNPDKVHVFPDPAVLLKPCSVERVNEIIKIEGIPEQKPLLGLIPVRGGIVFEKSFSYEKNPDKKHKLRVKLWVDLLLHLLDITDAHFVFIPHCIGSYYRFDDKLMMKDIYNEIPKGKDRITLITNEYSESELKGLIKQCEFILGERAHALIAGVSVATPCFALTVEEDLRMYYIINKMFGRKTFNLNNPDIEKLKTMLAEEWNNRKTIKLEMIKKANQIHHEAIKAALMLKEKIETILHKK